MSESNMKLRCQKKANVLLKKDSALEPLPIVYEFQHTKLPLLKEVLSKCYEKVDVEKCSFKYATRYISKEVQKHWIDRNVYTVLLRHVESRLATFIKEYTQLMKKKASEQTPDSVYFERCSRLNENLNKLFDIYCEDKTRRDLEGQRLNIPMIDDDYKFYKSMKTDRTFPCGRVDVTYHKKQAEAVRRADKLLKTQSSTITSKTCSNDIIDVVDNAETEDSQDSDYDVPSPKKRKPVFVNDQNSCLAITTRQSLITSQSSSEDTTLTRIPSVALRDSLQSVNDDVYATCADLDGEGFSLREMQVAIKTVGNGMLKQSWKIPKEKDRESKYKYDRDNEEEQEQTIFDSNTLPTRSAIRKKMKQMHAYSLGLISNEIIKSKEEGAVITHATDSTTRKKVGCFSPSGLHVNREKYLPLPTLQISSETTENIAKGVQTTFQMLEAASGHSASDLYKTVDLHMTDSTAHNKGVAEATAKLMGRSDAAGQLFCNPHTALGFDKGFESVINKIEIEMGMENIFKGFVLDVSIDQNSEAVSLTFVSWILSLFGPDLIQKPWNYHEDFMAFMRREVNSKTYLFNLKDGRFGLLSQCCAVVCFHLDDFREFLDQHDYITNKLACLVHDAMQFDYIPIIIATVAAFGPQLIHPYFSKTKGNSTHSELQIYFTSLHKSLNEKQIDSSFFEMVDPFFDGISKHTFKRIKKFEYSPDVIKAVSDTAKEQINECVLLANIIRKKMADVLAQQRGKYYGFGDVTKEFYVFDQSENVDQAPTHNLEQERQCGDHDNRLHKKPDLNAVSRGNILKLTTEMRHLDEDKGKFRKMRPVVKEVEKIQFEWKCIQEELKESKLSAKEAKALTVENRKLNILDFLKSVGGPFSDSVQIDDYLAAEKDPKKAQKRLKNEIVYFRDSSRSLPRTSHLFKIMTVDSTTKKRRTMTAKEFAPNLKTLLTRTSGQTEVTMEGFRRAIAKQSA